MYVCCYVGKVGAARTTDEVTGASCMPMSIVPCYEKNVCRPPLSAVYVESHATTRSKHGRLAHRIAEGSFLRRAIATARHGQPRSATASHAQPAVGPQLEVMRRPSAFPFQHVPAAPARPSESPALQRMPRACPYRALPRVGLDGVRGERGGKANAQWHTAHGPTMQLFAHVSA